MKCTISILESKFLCSFSEKGNHISFWLLEVKYLQSCDAIQSVFVTGNVNMFKVDKSTDELMLFTVRCR